MVLLENSERALYSHHFVCAYVAPSVRASVIPSRLRDRLELIYLHSLFIFMMQRGCA